MCIYICLDVWLGHFSRGVMVKYMRRKVASGIVLKGSRRCDLYNINAECLYDYEFMQEYLCTFKCSNTLINFWRSFAMFVQCLRSLWTEVKTKYLFSYSYSADPLRFVYSYINVCDYTSIAFF